MKYTWGLTGNMTGAVVYANTSGVDQACQYRMDAVKPPTLERTNTPWVRRARVDELRMQQSTCWASPDLPKEWSEVQSPSAGGIGRLLGLGADEAAVVAASRVVGVGIGEVVQKAASTVGKESVRVGSEQEAEQAAKQCRGFWGDALYDRNAPGVVNGWESADGTRRIFGPHADATGPHYNLVNLQTNGNLHVRW